MVKIFVILDGIGDKPCKALNELTPLQFAKTPNLDYFASEARHGYVYTLNEKLAPESDEAIMALLGYDPKQFYFGRGPLEAYGADMQFKKGYLALRTNFSTVEKDGIKLIDRRVGRTLTTKESKEFEQTLNKQLDLGFPFEFKATVGHRGIIIIKGEFSSNISNADPAYKKVGRFGVALTNNSSQFIQTSKPLDPDAKTRLSSNMVNEITKQSYEILKSHKLNQERKKKYLLEANILLTRDAGTELPELEKKKGWAAIVSMPLEIGLCRLAGMEILKFDYPESKSKDVYENLFDGLNKTIETSIKNIKENKFNYYFVHFKETDIPGHDNKPKEKVKMIELLDKKFFRFLKDLKNVELVVTGDHSTPCELKGHSADPVPLMHFDNKSGDVIDQFDEESCKEGSYGKLYGKDVLKKVGFE
ncbi:2,3-bisphosphoglycerate-independent phosphoglycerate mutase [Candidatus Woesearchaeota archaeon]|nr:2,3-bisphosphoglycerate-independent phosphoglycerate mutase [Candidatus Woesearchaeota archaeon]